MTPDISQFSSATSRASSGLGEAAAKARQAGAQAAAKDYESVFLSTMFSQAFTGISAEAPFGGGNAEKTWRGFLIEELSKEVAASGGIGIADHIKTELLAIQEAAS